MHSPSSATHSAEAGCKGCLAPYRVDMPIDAVGRYGRMFDLPALIADEDVLRRIGASGGFCDASAENFPTSGNDFSVRTGAASRTRDARIEAGWPFFGQFVAHDLTADRSPLTKHAEVELLANLRKAQADLEPLYGPGPAGAPYLYSRNDPAKLLDCGGDVPRNQEGIAAIVDPRNDSHIFMSQMQVAFIRAHNRLVDQFRAGGADEQSLFDHARRALVWHYQWLIINEFLPQLAGSELVNTILSGGPRFYRPDGAPFIPVEFADGAYRYGHSQVRECYVLRPGREAVRFFPDLLGFGPIGDRTVDWTLFFDVPGYPLAQRAKPIDARLVSSLISLPEAISGEVSGSAYASLAARDLQRGHGLGLPSGESVARVIGAEVLSEDELGICQDGWTGQTPLWIYVQREAAARHAGNRLGEVGGTIVAEVLIGVIAADPDSYLAQAPDWRPTLPAHEGDFKLRDLLVDAALSASALSEQAQHQSCPRLRAERGGLARHPPPEFGNLVDLRRGHGAADDGCSARLAVGGSDRLSCIVDGPYAAGIVLDRPDPGEQQPLQDGCGHVLPELSGVVRHRSAQLAGIGVGEQPDLRVPGEQERHAA